MESMYSESHFGFEEIFFSQTDLKGVILYGNDVFVRLSGYPRERLVGAPHNIIRHPDMPKAVFRLFWDRLRKGQPVVAYVKNRAADGRYYWVLASAFPTGSSFLSIRIRPSSELFEGVRGIYQETLKEEKAAGVDGGLAFLLERIQRLGLRDYDDFMLRALRHEIEARDQELVRRNLAAESVAYLGPLFAAMAKSEEICFDLVSRSDALISRFMSPRLLSTNLSLQAARMGNGVGQAGGILNVISTQFHSVAQEIVSHLGEARSAVECVADGMRHCFLDLAFLKLQTDMTEFMATERSGASAVCAAEFSRLRLQSFTAFQETLSKLAMLLVGAGRVTGEIQQFGSGLELIRQTGAVELARLGRMDSALLGCIEEMRQFNDELRQASAVLSGHLLELRSSTLQLSRGSGKIAHFLRQAS